MDLVAAAETVMAGTVEITLGGKEGVITDIRVVIEILGTVVATGRLLFG